MENKNFQNQIIIYKSAKNNAEMQVRFDNESVWLKQEQIAQLFGKDRSVITKHINKILKEKEVDAKSNVQKVHIANSDKPVSFYSLDVVLAVGYRVNSAQAIMFRKWATQVLKQYLIQGYAINEQKLQEAKNKFSQLKETISFLQKKAKMDLLKGQEKEVLNLLSEYSKTLTLLEQYDKNKLKIKKTGKTKKVLQYEECQKVIFNLRKELKEEKTLFGNEIGKRFESVAKNLYQTFSGKELYRSVEEKSAHLLYLTIKDHPFSDGNKRIGSFLFIYFLDKNKRLYKESGEKKINDNALVALALLIAESNPKEKDVIIKIVMNLIK